MRRHLTRGLGALNGLLGDRLAAAQHALGTRMAFIVDGVALPPGRTALLQAFAAPSPRLVVFVHGLMDTEHGWRMADGSDYGSLLAADLGWTPLYVRYNSGRAIPDNGAELAALLERLVADWPVPVAELTLVGHSMGGLVVRSACHHAALAQHAWLNVARRAVYLGTPHRGAPLERAGRAFTALLHELHLVTGDPVSRLIATVGDWRSDGIKDLGDSDLRHEDRARRAPTLGLRDPRHPVPLLPSLEHYLIAASLTDHPWLRAFFGDSIVPVPSATDGELDDRKNAALPASHVIVLRGMGHVALSHDRRVYAQLHHFCAGGSRSGGVAF